MYVLTIARAWHHSLKIQKDEALTGLELSLSDEQGILVSLPLAIRSKRDKPNTVRVEFLVKKTLLERAMLRIRCGNGSSETSYAVELKDYAPQKTNP